MLYDDIRVGIFTFAARQLQFYQVGNDNNNNNEIKILITDADDPYCPLPQQQLLLPLQSPKLDLLLEQLPSLIENPLTKSEYSNDSLLLLSESPEGRGDSCPAATIKAIQEGLASGGGGRLYVLTASHSTIGYGKLAQREVITTTIIRIMIIIIMEKKQYNNINKNINKFQIN